MRLLHTADWHLGRSLGGCSFLPDQAAILRGQFVEMVRATCPDAVLIAGDIFDRAIPPVDAMELLDLLLRDIVLRLRTQVILIPGNHDAADRLAFGAAVMREAGLHIATACLGEAIMLRDAHGEVAVFASGYASPALMAEVLGGEVTCHDTGFAALCARLRADLPPGTRSLMVAHGFVAGGTETDSERPLQVGGAKPVAAARFAGFDYVALGHLHRPQSMAEGRIRYSGSPLAYSFAEAGQRKSATQVDMAADGTVVCTELPFDPPRQLRSLEGTQAELLAAAPPGGTPDWLRIRLTDTTPVWGAMDLLREAYGTVLELTFARHDWLDDIGAAPPGARHDDPLALLQAFFTQMRDGPLTEDSLAVAREAIAAAQKAEA